MNEFIITINGKKHTVRLFENGKAEINGKIISVELSRVNDHSYLLKYGNKVFETTSNKIDINRFGFLIDGWYFDTVVRTQLQEKAYELMQKKEKHSNKIEIKAPMPGLILKILKQPGEEVKIGEPLLILEAMKMENEIRSTTGGVVKEMLVKEGSSVEKSTVIVIIE